MKGRNIKARLACYAVLALLGASAATGCSADKKQQHRRHQIERELGEEEFREGWNHAAEEEQREREESPTGESKWEELR